jgi:putative phosphoesterase
MTRRVAALYDVHGNLPALDAVLADVDAELIVVGGDVAAGPWPAETLERLRDLGERVRWIRGNADRELAQPSDGLEGGPPPEVTAWMRDRLSREQLDFLGALPLTETVEVDGVGRVLFCHATPRSDDELLTRISDEALWRDAVAGVDADVVVCGHTHVQFDRAVGDIRTVNAGSVGMPYEVQPGAYWLELGPDVEHRRTQYDWDGAAAAIAASGFPDEWPTATPGEATEFFERAVRERAARA